MEDRSAVDHDRLRDADDFRPSQGRAEIITIGSTRLDSYLLGTGAHRWWTPIASGGSMGVALAQGDTLFVSTAGSNEPGLPQWVSALAQYDKDKDGRISRAELLQDKELGEHFGWIDTSDDGFITEAEWSVARTLGLGAWGRSPSHPALRRVSCRPRPCDGASRRTCPTSRRRCSIRACTTW